MNTETDRSSALHDEGRSRTWSGLHPIVRLDFFVRLLACPIPVIISISSRVSTGEPTPLPMLIGLIAYGIGWPHISLFIARHSADVRRADNVEESGHR